MPSGSAISRTRAFYPAGSSRIAFAVMLRQTTWRRKARRSILMNWRNTRLSIYATKARASFFAGRFGSRTGRSRLSRRLRSSLMQARQSSRQLSQVRVSEWQRVSWPHLRSSVESSFPFWPTLPSIGKISVQSGPRVVARIPLFAPFSICWLSSSSLWRRNRDARQHFSAVRPRPLFGWRTRGRREPGGRAYW